MNPDGSVSDGSTFLPIPDLLAPAADISLVFLSANHIIFVKPSDEPVRVLGCTSQYQYCKPNAKLNTNTNCTPMAGIIQVASFAKSLWQTESQKALFNWSASAIMWTSMSMPRPLKTLGKSSLLSRYSLSNGIQGSLPDNQWQKEVEHWFTVILADLQRVVVEAATGPMDIAINPFLVRSQISEEHLRCRSQVSSIFYLLFDG